jgi:hypothetical protein
MAGRGRQCHHGQRDKAPQPQADQPPPHDPRHRRRGDQRQHPEVDGGHPQRPAQLEDAAEAAVAPRPAAEHHRQQVREGAGQGLQGEAGHDHRDQPGHMGLQVGDRGAGRHGAQVGHDRDREPGHAGPQHPGRGRVRGPAQGRADERDQRHRQPGRIGGQPGRGHHSALAGQPGGGHGQAGGQWRQRPADRSLQPRHHARPQHGRPQGELGTDHGQPHPAEHVQVDVGQS